MRKRRIAEYLKLTSGIRRSSTGGIAAAQKGCASRLTPRFRGNRSISWKLKHRYFMQSCPTAAKVNSAMLR